jgi:5'-nucleotidase
MNLERTDMKKPIILVDQDGVLADYTKRYLEVIADHFPELPFLLPEEADKFDTEKHFPEEYHAQIDALSVQAGFFRSLPPIPGALDAMREMLSLGYDVRICTAPKKVFHHCVPEKFLWVEQHLGREWVERIVMTRDKTLVSGAILIDDKPKVTGVRKPEWEHIVFDRPYNKNAKGRRCDWSNFRDVLPSLY